jgi:hypothetical protein
LKTATRARERERERHESEEPTLNLNECKIDRSDFISNSSRSKGEFVAFTAKMQLKRSN